MSFRFITPALHGLLDYAAAVALIVLPFVLDLGSTAPLALWLSVGGGAGLIGYSLLTDYRYGARGWLSYPTHLALDVSAAALFLAAPFYFGWTGLAAAYYVVMGIGVLLVVSLSEPEPLGLEEAL
jgi:hypothetical protein